MPGRSTSRSSGGPAPLISAITSANALGRPVSAAVCVKDVKDINEWRPYAERVYVGSEFCPERFPPLAELLGLAQAALECGLACTVVTPFLPPVAYKRVLGVLSGFLAWWRRGGGQELEVVVNDPGLLWRLGRTPDVSVALGRLLNKQKRDPRIAEMAGLLPPELRRQFAASSCSFRWFVAAMAELGVVRAEFDNLLHGVLAPQAEFRRSLHFPYGLVALGRNCVWTQTVKLDWRSPGRVCGQVCGERPVSMAPRDFGGKVVLNGNALYFRNEDVSGALASLAPDRLVYSPHVPN